MPSWMDCAGALSSRIELISRDKYASAVTEAGGLSPDELGKIVQTPEEAVGAVLLLDQIPRNIFRGREAAKVSWTPPWAVQSDLGAWGRSTDARRCTSCTIRKLFISPDTT
jgi:uncharacterized protein (DUF924 family)